MHFRYKNTFIYVHEEENIVKDPWFISFTTTVQVKTLLEEINYYSDTVA